MLRGLLLHGVRGVLHVVHFWRLHRELRRVQSEQPDRRPARLYDRKLRPVLRASSIERNPNFGSRSSGAARTTSRRRQLAIQTSDHAQKPPPNKRLQLTPNSLLQSIHGTLLAAAAVPQR